MRTTNICIYMLSLRQRIRPKTSLAKCLDSIDISEPDGRKLTSMKSNGHLIYHHNFLRMHSVVYWMPCCLLHDIYSLSGSISISSRLITYHAKVSETHRTRSGLWTVLEMNLKVCCQNGQMSDVNRTQFNN